MSAESVARQYAHATFDVARGHDHLDNLTGSRARNLDAERAPNGLFRAIARLDVSRQHRTRS